MPREKSRSLAISLSYRLKTVGARLLGKQRTLKFFLNCTRLFWRFAFELSGEIYGDGFHNRANALSEHFLKRWITADNTVVDIGCGVGRWCVIASKYATLVVGIDYDANHIAQARIENSASNIEYLVGDATRDLAERKFDLAILTHVIEHIEEPDKLLRELKNVTAKLIVEVPDFEHDPLNSVRLKLGLPFYYDGDHVREYTQEILENQLTRNGWRILETYKNGGAVLAVAEVA